MSNRKHNAWNRCIFPTVAFVQKYLFISLYRHVLYQSEHDWFYPMKVRLLSGYWNTRDVMIGAVHTRDNRYYSGISVIWENLFLLNISNLVQNDRVTESTILQEIKLSVIKNDKIWMASLNKKLNILWIIIGIT